MDMSIVEMGNQIWLSGYTDMLINNEGVYAMKTE